MLALLTDEVIKTIADGRPDLLALLGHIRTDLDSSCSSG